MDTNADSLLRRLNSLAAGEAAPRRYVVAYSGGRDSTVLLHLLAGRPDRRLIPLHAVHVNHHLQPDADAWQAHCVHVAAAFGVTLQCIDAPPGASSAGGIEAAARHARYAALATCMQAGDWLLTAHHADDQAETVLLNLLRGSGVAGIAGIGERQSWGPGQLVRPLLGVSAAALAAYARGQALDWVDDASNDDLRFDRNFLRHRVLPLLSARWPAAATRIARSATLASQAAGLLDEQAAADLAALGSASRIAIDGLQGLSRARQCALLRHAVRRVRLPALPSAQLERILSDVLPARADAEPSVEWPGAAARRYRGHLYLLPQQGERPAPPDGMLRPGEPLTLAAGEGELALVDAPSSGGIARGEAARGLRAGYRQGGETIRPAGHACTRQLKKLLQQQAVVPWMRSRIPLLYAGDRLVAVGDLWVAMEFHADDGLAVRWHGRPELY